MLLQDDYKVAKSYIILSWIGTAQEAGICFHISKNLVNYLRNSELTLHH